MKDIIEKFIVWYLCKYCNCLLYYENKVVRVYSEAFYKDKIVPYLEDLHRHEKECEFNGK